MFSPAGLKPLHKDLTKLNKIKEDGVGFFYLYQNTYPTRLLNNICGYQVTWKRKSKQSFDKQKMFRLKYICFLFVLDSGVASNLPKT